MNAKHFLPILMAALFLGGCTKNKNAPSPLASTEESITLRSPESYPWRGHAAPYDFTFGNHIDTHQQSKLVGENQLRGFFYIKFTGNTVDGLPEATHGNCNKITDECTVGWRLHGVYVEKAQLIAHEEGEHPTWLISPEDMPEQSGYTHFHWLGETEHAGGLTVGDCYDGYLLKLTARDQFFFRHHGGFNVTPGIDYETHHNVEVGHWDCE